VSDAGRLVGDHRVARITAEGAAVDFSGQLLDFLEEFQEQAHLGS
jgi:hypothetical protein